MNDYIILIGGMALVTYIPRMFPLVILPGKKLPVFLERFLSYVPVAVLTALIFPGIISSTDHPLTALVGGFIALILALKKFNLMIVVMGSIFTVFLLSLI